MKTLKLPILICILLAALFTTGCTTVQTANGPVKVVDTNLVDRSAIYIRGVAADGALLAMKYDRNAEAYLRMSAAVFDGALLSKDVSATSIRKSLMAIPVKELHGELAAVGIQTVLTSYEVFVSNHLKGVVNQNYIAATILAAIRDGINSALGPPPAAFKPSQSLFQVSL